MSLTIYHIHDCQAPYDYSAMTLRHIVVEKEYNFESDVESHLNGEDLSELSDFFEEGQEDNPQSSHHNAISLDEISYSRDLNMINVPSSTKPKAIVVNKRERNTGNGRRNRDQDDPDFVSGRAGIPKPDKREKSRAGSERVTKKENSRSAAADEVPIDDDNEGTTRGRSSRSERRPKEKKLDSKKDGSFDGPRGKLRKGQSDPRLASAVAAPDGTIDAVDGEGGIETAPFMQSPAYDGQFKGKYGPGGFRGANFPRADESGRGGRGGRVPAGRVGRGFGRGSGGRGGRGRMGRNGAGRHGYGGQYMYAPDGGYDGGYYLEDGTFYYPEEYYDYGNSGYDYEGYNGSDYLAPDHASTAHYSSYGSDMTGNRKKKFTVGETDNRPGSPIVPEPHPDRIVTPAMVEADLAAVAALNPHAQEFVPTFTFR